MNGSAASRQNGDGTADRLEIRLTRRTPGSGSERSPYKTARADATRALQLRSRIAPFRLSFEIRPPRHARRFPFTPLPSRSCTSI
ncbi:hypothetical protein FPJ27_10840 [Burkholderia sp. MS455]|nr:hypothetical protein FPJ27_10840 [Burkholderia sp. MS455]